MKPVIIFLIFFLLVTTISCDTTEPTEDNTPAGRRDYEWTVDTLKTDEMLTITRIWGSSAKDVWAIGNSSWSGTAIWHYDGNRWSYDSIARGINPWSVYGFSSNEVWLGNSNSTIWKYNGNMWSQFGTYPVAGFSNVVFNNFYGISANDIYGIGDADNYNNSNYKAIIIHYNGSNWEYLNIPDLKIAMADLGIDYKSGTLLIVGFLEDLSDVLYSYSSEGLKEIHHGGFISVFNINESVYAMISQKIYRYKNGKLHLWLDKTGTEYRGKIWGGKSEKDFFWQSVNGIGHFNGTDMQLIYRTDLDIYCGYIFDGEIFFVCKDIDSTQYNIVIHGKLKKEAAE